MRQLSSRISIIFLVISIFPISLLTVTTTQSVGYSIIAIDSISISGNPGTLTINSATAGSDLNPATDASTTYAVTTNGSARKVTGQITSGTVPFGLTLSVSLQAPTAATSAGFVSLSTGVAQNLVTGISNLNQSGLTITYKLTPNIFASEGSGSWSVTFTITP